MDCKGNTNSFNVNNSFNKIVHATKADDKHQVLQWLSSLEPQNRHQHLRESRLDGVGQWIFRRSEFCRWDTGKDASAHSVLFCHGDPGVGKTHLSSLVIDRFYGSGQDIAVTGLYCDYLDRNEQTTSNMLGAMLKQLVGRADIPEDVRITFEDAMEHFGGVRPRVSELLKMLKTAIARRQRVVICIDGLDESLAVHRENLLDSLRAIVRELPNVRLFLTGRPFIRSEVERYFPGVDTISVQPIKADIEAFVRMKLEGDPEPDAMDGALKADIMEIIPKRISEIFLLVSLSTQAILGETTIHRRRKKLKQLSGGQDVGDVYTATLKRIREQENDKSRLGMEAIMWVAHSERPLRPDELCQALGVEIGSEDLNSDNSPSIRTILNCGLGLVTVDSSSSTVRLVHFTLQEHILASPTLFHSPHSVIAEVCLTYLNFACVRDLPPTLSSPPPTTPFLEYASCHWGAHARRQTTENIVSLALNLLDRFDTHISCKLLLLKEDESERPFNIVGDPTGFTGLHGGALLGVLEIFISLIEIKKWDLNATDLHYNTVLAWAVRKGHGGVVKVLLEEEGVNPNKADKWGRTPLALAAQCGYEGVVKMLLGRNDIHPGTASRGGLTPLWWAAQDGHEGIVKMLLERNDVNPDPVERLGQTPLSRAALCGHIEVVKMLLGRNEVNPDSVDGFGQTPLGWAAQCGYEGIVEMLLERNDVDPDAGDIGCTPLLRAAMNREARIVEMLLERNDVNPDRADEDGRTPLSWAAENGDLEIMCMLLCSDKVNPATADQSGRTPFSWVAGGGCEEIAEVLLEWDDVNPDTADEDGRAPFSRVAEGGYEAFVKMLLERNDVDPGTPDKSGRTPFSWAAGHGHEGIVKVLLERKDVNPDIPDRSGRTPLSWGAGSGHVEVVKMLLERNNVNPDMADRDGRTPMSWAAAGGHAGVVQLLQERCDLIAKLVLGEGSSKSSTTELTGLPNPPFKRIRRL